MAARRSKDDRREVSCKTCVTVEPARTGLRRPNLSDRDLQMQAMTNAVVLAAKGFVPSSGNQVDANA